MTRQLIADFVQRPDVSRPRGADLDLLTDREVEVLVCVGKGWSNGEIAEHLYVTAATAKTHVARLLMKLHARDRAQLIVTAYERGLVTPRPPTRG